MKLSDLCLIFSLIFVTLCTILSVNYVYKLKVEDIKSSYSEMIELAIDGALKKDEVEDTQNMNELSLGNITTIDFNKNLVVNEFLKLLSLNFNGLNNENTMSMHVPIIAFIEHDGVTLNIYDKTTNVRYMLNKVFTLDNNEKIDLLKRQMKLMGISFELPIVDTIYNNAIKNKTLLVVIDGIKVSNIENYSTVKVKAKEIKNRGKYVSIDNETYEKINPTRFNDLLSEKNNFKIYDTMKDAAYKKINPKL